MIRYLLGFTVILSFLGLKASIGLAATLTHGPVFGGVTPYQARVFLKTDSKATVAILYGTKPDLSDGLKTPPFTTSSQADFTRKILISGLQPRVTYYVNIDVNGIHQFGQPYPSFATFSERSTHQPFKFIVMTDFLNQKLALETSAVFFNASQEGAAFAFIGGDFDHRNPTTLSAKRGMFRSLYDPQSIGLSDFVNGILRKMPITHQWDDHDAGQNNIDRTYQDWNLSYQAFHEYVPTYALPPIPPGVWQRFRYAHVDFFILDGRSQRDPNTDPDDQIKSMLDGNNLGDDGQLEWLKNGLLGSTATWKIIFSSVVTNPTTKLTDGWAAFQTEWNMLKSFIKENQITGVVFLSGDLHIGGIDNGIAAGFPEMVVPAPNLKACGSGSVGKWSEGTFYNPSGPCNGYGVVTVLTNPDRLLLEIKDENRQLRLSYVVSP